MDGFTVSCAIAIEPLLIDWRSVLGMTYQPDPWDPWVLGDEPLEDR
jgi:hypothetical protein